MGAAASVKHLYKDGLRWFSSYVDSETYYADFEQIDKDHNGGIGFVELKKWIDVKVAENPGSSWEIFKANQQVLNEFYQLR